MRRLIIALIATVSTIALTQIVSAADMSMKAPAHRPPVAPTYNWTGFYIGGNAGYGWGNANDTMTLGGQWLQPGGDIFTNQLLTPFGNGQLKPNGFIGGVQAGYNYQTGQWVFGVEVDANYFRMKKSVSQSFLNLPDGNGYTFTSSFETNWLVTARPRIGYSFDRFLVYGTGGLAIADQKFSQTITGVVLGSVQTGSVSNTAVGWTMGAGAEYALGSHWSLKAEYLYVDLGSVSFSTVDVGNCGPISCSLYTGGHSAHLKENIVRAGINYNFN